MKKMIFLIIMALTAISTSAETPDWIEGQWQTEEGQVWEFELINSGNEGIITIYDENGNSIDFWGWKWMGNSTYHVKRYYDYFESFVIYVRSDNEFMFRNFRDANTFWILSRMIDK